MSVARRLSFLLLICLFTLAPLAQAQVTTGTLAGSVKGADGSALPGVTIEAVHVPTGTRYSDVTAGDGRFGIPNVRVGGPYTVTASLSGFRNADYKGVQVPLGTAAEVPITLQLETVSESITVTASVDPIINPDRTGSSSSVSEEQIETLPTVNRSLQDFARTNPYFRVDSADASSTIMNVAGKNARYNTIQIDGAVNNDLFGLAASGTPGGQTNAQPISIDALQTIQLVVSPYDVRQGGFTGGGINAITRSGSNEFTGSVFATNRNQDFIGDGPFNQPVADFEQDQYGGRLGGPILRDRLFFFVNGEINRRKQPTGTSADGTTDIVYNNPNFPATTLRDLLMSRYNHDAGGLGDIVDQTDSDNYFVRFDWNAGNKHQLTARHNYVDAIDDVIDGRTSAARFRFPTSTYTIADETNSTVLQLNSVFTANAFNEARVGYQTIRDVRTLGTIFPSIEIGGSAQNGTLTAGSERFSGANALDQDILEVTDDFTWTYGNHTLVFGTHNEFFDFKNLFLSDVYGAYFFPTFADFENNKPSEYRISFATGSDPRRPTTFGVAQYGFYVNDQWRMNNNVTLTFGVRADMPKFDDTPTFNPVVENLIGFRTDATPDEKMVISPRFGFNWNPGGAGHQQVRGGIGIFAGRTPYVWISNAYAGTGVEQVSLTCTGSCITGNNVQFNPDPLNQPKSFGAGGTLTVDLTDPDFEFPRIIRATLGYDRDLFAGIRGTVEAVMSQTQQDVFYHNVNLKPTGATAFDGRPTFTRVNTGMSDAYFLTNTSQGEETMLTLQLNRPFTNGFVLGTSYAWQDAKSAFDATSSRAVSNWRFRHSPGNIFEDDVATSQFEVEHRFNVNLSYSFNTRALAHTFALYYNAQSGRPYSILMGGDPNTDGNTSNDLLFVPADANAFILCPTGANAAPNATSACRSSSATFTPVSGDRLFTYLRAAGIDDFGRILDRYESNEPWSRQLDFHYEIGIPFRGIETQLTFDVLNALNLLANDSGNVYFVANQNVSVLNFRGIDPTSGKPVYQEASSTALTPGNQFSLASIRSRWQARFGLRVNF